MNSRKFLAFTGCIGLMALAAGCTPSAREDVGKAGDNLDSAAQKSAAGTAEAVDKAGAKAADATKDATQDVQRAADNAGKDIKQGAEKVGTATKDAAQDAQRAVVKTGDAVGAATKDAAETVSLTPKVRNAIIADDKVKMPDLNVDTKNDSKSVVVMGTATSDAMKMEAISDAKKALADSKSDYKVVDQIKVGAK